MRGELRYQSALARSATRSTSQLAHEVCCTSFECSFPERDSCSRAFSARFHRHLQNQQSIAVSIRHLQNQKWRPCGRNRNHVTTNS